MVERDVDLRKEMNEDPGLSTCLNLPHEVHPCRRSPWRLADAIKDNDQKSNTDETHVRKSLDEGIASDKFACLTDGNIKDMLELA